MSLFYRLSDTPAPALWFASSKEPLAGSSYSSVTLYILCSLLTAVLFQAGWTLFDCKTIKGLYTSVSTYHLVFEPYFHFPLGFLTWTKHLRPSALNKQQVLYIPYGNTKSKTIIDPTVIQLQLVPPQISSAWMVAAVQQKRDPLVEIIGNMTSCGVSFSAGREVKNISERTHLERSSPTRPLPINTVTLWCPPINMDLRWSRTVLTNPPIHRYQKSEVS